MRDLEIQYLFSRDTTPDAFIFHWDLAQGLFMDAQKALSGELVKTDEDLEWSGTRTRGTHFGLDSSKLQGKPSGIWSLPSAVPTDA